MRDTQSAKRAKCRFSLFSAFVILHLRFFLPNSPVASGRLRQTQDHHGQFHQSHWPTKKRYRCSVLFSDRHGSPTGFFRQPVPHPPLTPTRELTRGSPRVWVRVAPNPDPRTWVRVLGTGYRGYIVFLAVRSSTRLHKTSGIPQLQLCARLCQW
jgi:hypothetical protein